MNTDGSGVWWMISLAGVGCGRTWPSNQPGGGVIMAFFSFFNQIPHQKESDISVCVFSLA